MTVADLLRHPVRTDPLIVFVHVPKTAGSSVNAMLRSVFPDGRDHLEHVLDQPDLARPVLNRLRWVSGHFDLSTFLAAARPLTARPFRFFSAVRDPDAQVMSHYNWLIEIHARGPAVFEAHPPHIRAISEAIRATDHSDPEAVAARLGEFPALFLNLQSRLLLGAGFRWDDGALLDRLDRYEFIATETMIPELLFRMTGCTVARPPRENAARYHFPREVFGTPPLRRFLARRNTLDMLLYHALRAPRFRSAVRPEFRAAPAVTARG